MGLRTTHGAFDAPYATFHAFRCLVAKSIGGSFSEHDDPSMNPDAWYWDDSYSRESNPGLAVFFDHSDCDGFISPGDCVLVADELEALLPAIEDLDTEGIGEVAKRFIIGCRKAAEASELLHFW